MTIATVWDNWKDAEAFSGVFSVEGEAGVLFEKACGWRNRGEALFNNRDTLFGVASGTKLFTGLAVCKLISEGRLSLEDTLSSILPYGLGQVDPRVTIHHLLTHTSGVGDYIDEEAPDSMAALDALYNRYPVCQWERLEYYLQMITPLPPKFAPGERFGYSNAGYVLLGLAVEAASGMSYQRYVTEAILRPLGLARTGFYRMDALPENTAMGYMQDEATGEWRANIFKIPIIGGADGGIFTCAGDMAALWRAVFAGRVLEGEMMEQFLAMQVRRNAEKSYGLGVYRYEKGESIACYAVGGDFGIDFFSAYFPAAGISVSALGNTEVNTWPLLEGLFSVYIGCERP